MTDSVKRRPSRDAYYTSLLDMTKTRRYRLPPRAEWEDRMDYNRAYLLKVMFDRKCAMTMEGMVRIVHGPDPFGGTTRTRYLVRELVIDGELAVQHMPDGNDRYYLPGGLSDPTTGTGE